MAKKLTINLSDEVYEGLYRVAGQRHIGRFLEDLARPHVLGSDLTAAYREMAADQEREAEAAEWCEALIGDTVDETR